MKDSKAVKLIALAFNKGFSEGYTKGYSCVDEAEERVAEAYEKGRHEALGDEALALAQAKSRAYEEGYKQGLQSENSYNSGLEAGVKAERERALEAEPKLSVWFMPCGPMPVSPEGEVLGYPPGLLKSLAIKAIREAYGSDEGYGFKEVKDLVEIEPGTRVVCGQTLPMTKAVTLYLQLQAAGFDPVLKG